MQLTVIPVLRLSIITMTKSTMSATRISYTKFLEHFHRKYVRAKGSLKLEHIAAHEMFVDFAGKKLEIVDKNTGAVKLVEVFISKLPCS